MHKISKLLGTMISAGICLSLAPAYADDSAWVEKNVREIVKKLHEELSGTVKSEMQAGGPTRVIEVCTDKAPEIYNRLSREYGAQVRRVGTRVRNPLYGMPDSWEQKVLEKFKERADKGEKLSGMSFGERVTEVDGSVSYRYMQAIGLKANCLMCHGQQEQVPSPVHAVIKERYPYDKATGYKPGDLRGAFSVRLPM